MQSTNKQIKYKNKFRYLKSIFYLISLLDLRFTNRTKN